MNIDQTVLINLLNTSMSNDREIGWNSAIIHLLKLSVLVPEEHFLLKKGISKKDIAEIDALCKDNSKLMAVKKIKECTMLGLKESKDLFEEYYDTGLWQQGMQKISDCT